MTDNNTATEALHFAFAGNEPAAVGGDFAESYSGVTVSVGATDGHGMDAAAWTDTPLGLMITVCDGMGPSGERAARVAIKAVAAHMREVGPDDDAVENLRIAISAAQFAVRTLTERTADGSGATIGVLLLGSDRATAAWLGDVRIYQLRGRTAVFRSTDHSKVMELVRAGVLTDEQARTSSEAHIVTRSLGHTRDDKARVARLPYLRGDRFAVCSDGVWRTFPQKKLLKLLGRPRDPEKAVTDTIEAVTAEGPADDMTLAVIDTTTNSTIKTRMRTSHKIILAVLTVLLVCSIACNVLQYFDIIPGAATAQPASQPAADTTVIAVNQTHTP